MYEGTGTYLIPTICHAQFHGKNVSWKKNTEKTLVNKSRCRYTVPLYIYVISPDTFPLLGACGREPGVEQVDLRLHPLSPSPNQLPHWWDKKKNNLCKAIRTFLRQKKNVNNSVFRIMPSHSSVEIVNICVLISPWGTVKSMFHCLWGFFMKSYDISRSPKVLRILEIPFKLFVFSFFLIVRCCENTVWYWYRLSTDITCIVPLTRLGFRT